MPACNQVFGHGIFNCWFDHFTIMCWCRSRHRPRVQWPKLTTWCLWSQSQGTCMYLVGSHYTWGFHVNLSKFNCTSTGQVKPHNWPLPALYRTGETSQLTSTSTVQDRWNLTIDLYWHPYRTGELSQLTSTGTRTGQVNSHNWPSINWPPLAPVQDRWYLTIDQVSIDLHWHHTGQVKPHNWPLLAPYRTGELSQLTSTGTSIQDRWTLTIDLHWHQYTGQVNSHNWPPLAPYRTGELSQLTSTGTRTGQVNSHNWPLLAPVYRTGELSQLTSTGTSIQDRWTLTIDLYWHPYRTGELSTGTISSPH